MQRTTAIRCSACGQPFNMTVQDVIDVSKNPQAKALLLSNQFNIEPCPQCGTINNVLIPLLYHDPAKELLIAFVPPELQLNKEQNERVVGDLMKQLPKDSFKGYMFNPKRPLTFQGMVDLILQADGVTPEMMAEQRARVDFLQRLIETENDEALTKLITESDAQIDERLFQAISLMLQRLLQQGPPEVAQKMLYVQNRLVELSTFGQSLLKRQAEQEAMVQSVAQELDALGDDPQREDFLNLALKYQGDQERLQALVGLAYIAFDETFFQILNAYIGKQPADQRASLEQLRDNLREYSQMVDQQSQARLQNALALLQLLVNAPDLDAAIAENLQLIDDAFMQVLSANIQEMERRRNVQASARLKQVYERVVSAIQSEMQPELLFVNQLLTAESESAASAMIANQAKQFGEPLLEVIDAVDDLLTSQGRADISQRLKALRQEVVSALDQ